MADYRLYGGARVIILKRRETLREWTFPNAWEAHVKAKAVSDALGLPWAYDGVTATYVFDVRDEG